VAVLGLQVPPDSGASCLAPVLTNIVLTFPIIVNTKHMSRLHILCNHAIAEPGRCFECILARSWYTPGASSDADHGERLEWLSVILSDNNRVRAAAFHVAYSQCCSQVIDDDDARMALKQQYNSMQCSVTPISCLPTEIFRNIFSIALDIGQSRMTLVHVCQHWRSIVEGMPNAWNSLKLQAWTPPESVRQSLHKAHIHPLAIEIDVDKIETITEGQHSALAIAAESAARWETLTITSLPQSEQEVQYVHRLLSMHLPPINRLRHLRVIQSVSSSLLSPLIHSLATAAVGDLSSMEVDSSPAVLVLAQPANASLFGSLTTFKAHLPTMSVSVDLLPHFNQLEVLELTNLLLPLYASHNLPFSHTLHHLYLRAVSIQWMGGQVFPQLESCTLIAAPMRTHPLLLDVTLPACTTFHIGNKDIAPIRRFHMPNVYSLEVRSHEWSPGRGNEQIAHLVEVVYERPLQPHALHLAILCKGSTLLSLLELLPTLKELVLDLARPSSLGRHFFTSLLAKPFGEIDWTQSKRLENTEGWTSMICPFLSILGLRYQKWLRQSDCIDWLAPLFALSWSRERTATPLKLQLHFKPSQGSWRSFELSPQLTMPMSMLAVPSLGQYDQPPPVDLLDLYYTSAILHSIDKNIDTDKPPSIRKHTLYVQLVFPFCFNHLQVLDLKSDKTRTLNVLPSFQQLKNLSLSRIQIPPRSIEGELPLVHTLRELSLQWSTLAWMDGKVFSQLERFHVDENGWPESFEQNVQMPVCTNIKFYQNRLKVLPLLHSSFYFPPLSKWELGLGFYDFSYDEQGMQTLQRIQAKTFRFAVYSHYQILMDILDVKNEVQQLDLTMYSSSSQQLLAKLSVISENTKKVPCPNMKVLGLQFHFVEHSQREHVIQWCRQMVDARRLAGSPMERCCIWWYIDDWEKPPPLVLVTQSGEARMEE
jgi:hypothetical protein